MRHPTQTVKGPVRGSGTARVALAGALGIVSGTSAALAGDPGLYAPPPGYYDPAIGSGPALKAQLGLAMTIGHVQRSYGDFRFAAGITDADPSAPGNLIGVYDGASLRAAWDSGITWNREHVWPQSRQPGDASNSTRGNLGDPHALRPARPSVNGSRGNKPFGNADTTGGHRSLGDYFFPGDADKGDIARSLFYSDTRWGPSLGLSLVNSFPAGNQMGNLDALIAWHYLDEPDLFEIRRNHAIYSQAMNPAYHTNNRNAFVDLPETVWSVYVDQNNDSTLWVGDAPAADGSSALALEVNALVGDAIAPASVTLSKTGFAGTYYRVSVTGPVVSSITGRHNAFAIGIFDTQRSLDVSVDPTLTGAAGFHLAEVVVDNLDVTTGSGAGMGAQDADDVVSVEINVFEPATPSFDPAQPVTEIMLDLGVIDLGSGDAVAAFDLYNIAPQAFGAPMDVDLVAASGDTDALTVGFDSVVALPAGEGEMVLASLDDDAEGSFQAVYTFRAFNDRALFAQPGPGRDLVLTLTGVVGAGVCAPDLAEPFGTLNFFDLAAYLGLYTAADPQADLNDDGVFNFFDVSAYIASYNAGCP
jgi:endonuclease I